MLVATAGCWGKVVIEASLDVVFLEVMVALCMLAPLEAKAFRRIFQARRCKGAGLGPVVGSCQDSVSRGPVLMLHDPYKL